MKNDIELADIAEILVQKFNKQVNSLHQQELVIIYINSKNKIKASVTSVNYLEVLILVIEQLGNKKYFYLITISKRFFMPYLDEIGMFFIS